MYITKIKIVNFKSIKAVEFFPSPKLNIFIGENSVGKSNIFDAIMWPLGPIYPSFNNTSLSDRFQGVEQNKIAIELTYSNRSTISLTETGPSGKSGLFLDNGYITDHIRNANYCSAYLGIERKVADYLPSNRWSLIGRILLEINKLFLQDKFDDILDEDTGEVTNGEKKVDVFKREIENIRDNILFTVKDAAGVEVMRQFVTILQKESARQLNKPESSFSVDLNLYDPWNFFRTLQMIIHEHDTGMKFQASELGMGIQASISIAVLKAYASLKLRNQTPIFIDEPELFLHPLAQRNFYKVLNELADSGTQVFITTHSPNFLNVGRFNEIFVVRKSNSCGTYISDAKPTDFVIDFSKRYPTVSTSEPEILDRYKNAYENTGDTQKANEAFFAKKILLVEGESEALIIPYFFELVGYDHIADGLSIVKCGSKSELDRFYRLYAEFGIPCFILFDSDGNHCGTAEEPSTVNKNRAITAFFGEPIDFPDGSVNEYYLGFSKTLNDNLNLSTGISGKGLKLYWNVKSQIHSGNQVPFWAKRLAIRLKNLPETVTSVLEK